MQSDNMINVAKLLKMCETAEMSLIILCVTQSNALQLAGFVLSCLLTWDF